MHIVLLIGWLVVQPSLTSVARDGSTQTFVCAATLRCLLQIKLALSPSHAMPTHVQSALARFQLRQASCWEATMQITSVTG